MRGLFGLPPGKTLSTENTNENTPPSGTSRYLALTVWSVLTGLLIMATLDFAFESARHFSGSAMDGPFQFYDALRRIQAGFRPGVDFQFFHGLGVPYTQYWLYRIFGGGLRGAELTRQLVAATATILLYAGIFQLYFRDRVLTICLTGLALAASFALQLSGVVFALAGMVGVRSALPTLIPAVIYAVRGHRHRGVIVGALMGLALWVSTEQGLAFAMAFTVIALAGLTWSDNRRARLQETLISLSLAVVVLVAAEIMVGGIAGMRGALRYNFKIIPLDQYWYFGSPPNNFFTSWPAVLQGVLLNWWLALALLGTIAGVVLFVVLSVRLPAEDRAFTESLALYATYGLISLSTLLGVVTQIYTTPARRVLLIMALAGLAYYARRTDARQGRSLLLGVSRPIATTAGLLIAVVLVTAPVIGNLVVSTFTHTVADHLLDDAQFSIDGIWPQTLRADSAMIAGHRHPDGSAPVTWSTYSGWMEARNGTFNPSFDYIIHALGPENRVRYVEQFQSVKPDLVQTVLPTYSQYEAWLEANHWSFYDALLDNYRVAGVTPWSIFWERRSQPLPPSQLVGTLNVDAASHGAGFQIPPLGQGLLLLEVQIDYEVHNPLSALPIVGNSPRYLAVIDGALQKNAVSLAPYDTTKRFPLLVEPGSQVRFTFGTYGLLPGASWKAHRIRVYQKPLDDGDDVWLASLSRSLQPRIQP